jgi:hypothetical protein
MTLVKRLIFTSHKLLDYKQQQIFFVFGLLFVLLNQLKKIIKTDSLIR